MSLIWFHRLLIAVAIAFCGGFALWQLRAFARDGSVATLLIGLAFALGAVAFAYYLRHLSKFLGRAPDDAAGPR